MGGSSSKDQVVVAQTASGGTNQSQLDQLHRHISTNNVVLSIVAVCFFGVLMLGGFYLYRKCHRSWVREELRKETIRRVVQGTANPAYNGNIA